MGKAPMLDSVIYVPQIDHEIPEPDQLGRISFLPAARKVDSPVATNTFDGFLAEVEQCVPDTGQLLLFTGEQLRLELVLLRHRKNPRVIWGLKSHEDWAFKATLLRFARSMDTVRLVLSSECEAGHRIQGWMLKRSMDSFWAWPLPADQANRLWKRWPGSCSLDRPDA